MYLYVDTEFRNELNLPDVGAYKYLNHESAELLMVAYAFGDEDVKLWECHKGPIPEDLRKGLQDELQIVVAWNCQFERLGFSIHLGISIEMDRWVDPMILARHMSMPGSLEKVSKILDLKSKKLTEFFIKDQSMVDMFSTPLRLGGEVTLFGIEPTDYRNWNTHPKEWEKFCEYCCLDVEAMREAFKRCRDFPLPEWEYELFALNEAINDHGIYTDSVLLQGAGIVVDKEFEGLRKEFFELTGISKPKSNPAVLKFVRSHGYTFPSIGKQFVNRALAGECKLDEVGRRALQLRLQLSKSSVSKLEAIRDSVQEDGRVRGLFNFMGAARTARWTSGLIQMQNLAKASKEVEKKYDLALELLKKGDHATIKKEFSSPIDVAVAALRPIFKAPQGSEFVIADLNAIEARGTAWVANCEPMMQEFREGLDPYISFAALMDGHATYDEILAIYKAGNKKIRTDAKAPKLGCCYGLSPGGIEYDKDGNAVKTGLLGYAASMGIELTPEYAEKAVMIYRQSYSEVVNFWYDLHRAFINVVEQGGTVELGPLVLEKKGRVVCMWLPSGRALHYVNPEVIYVDAVSKKGRPYKRSEIYIDGIDQKTHQWTRIPTRGSRLFENAIQSICRDILGCGMLAAAEKKMRIVLTCHDEVVVECKQGEFTVEDLVECMTRDIPWAEGFLIGAEGFKSDYYVKN